MTMPTKQHVSCKLSFVHLLAVKVLPQGLTCRKMQRCIRSGDCIHAQLLINFVQCRLCTPHSLCQSVRVLKEPAMLILPSEETMCQAQDWGLLIFVSAGVGFDTSSVAFNW